MNPAFASTLLLLPALLTCVNAWEGPTDSATSGKAFFGEPASSSALSRAPADSNNALLDWLFNWQQSDNGGLFDALSPLFSSSLDSSSGSDTPQQQQQADEEEIDASFRIVGGAEVDVGRYKYIASLRNQAGDHICGGTLITKEAVLTAAHCLDSGSVDEVHIGRHLSRGEDSSWLQRPCIETYIHPNWSSSTQTGDIAICILSAPVEDIAPVHLAPSDLSVPIQSVPLMVLGYGYLREGGPLAPDLQSVEISNLGLPACKAVYDAIDNTQLCAGSENGGEDACQGDSGGPLLLLRDQPHSNNTDDVLVGVVSYGRGCARAGYPGVYTRIAAYTSWITETIKEAFMKQHLPRFEPAVLFDLAASESPPPSNSDSLFGGLSSLSQSSPPQEPQPPPSPQPSRPISLFSQLFGRDSSPSEQDGEGDSLQQQAASAPDDSDQQQTDMFRQANTNGTAANDESGEETAGNGGSSESMSGEESANSTQAVLSGGRNSTSAATGVGGGSNSTRVAASEIKGSDNSTRAVTSGGGSKNSTSTRVELSGGGSVNNTRVAFRRRTANSTQAAPSVSSDNSTSVATSEDDESDSDQKQTISASPPVYGVSSSC